VSGDPHPATSAAQMTGPSTAKVAAGTAPGHPAVLAALRDKGLRPLTVSELLGPVPASAPGSEKRRGGPLPTRLLLLRTFFP
jgi:hypothetical protein